jgi:hypothetical protein
VIDDDQDRAAQRRGMIPVASCWTPARSPFCQKRVGLVGQAFGDDPGFPEVVEAFESEGKPGHMK